MTIESVKFDARIPGAASARFRTIGSRRVVCVEFDSSAPAPPLTSEMTTVMTDGCRMALEERVPLLLIINSAGADIAEGVAPLDGWGRAARILTRCSGRVPTFAIVDGPAVSGPALLLGLVDHVIMTSRAYAFVNGPVMVEQFTGIAISKDELGSAETMERTAGLATCVVDDRDQGLHVVTDILDHLPDHSDLPAPTEVAHDPVWRSTPEAGEAIPETATGSYDVRTVIEAIVDDGDYLEIRSRWATNVVTAYARLGGRSIGIVANQPLALAGTLDIPASQKAARFVNCCDAFGLPILTLVDTPGFYPGKDLEWRGMIRHGAQLVYAYGQATVPRVCVILRKSYGGAYIVMDSKEMGNDICLAWPWAELAVMGAGQASAILRRGASDIERADFEADYAERLLNPYVAAERGYVDDVIDPADTRRVVAGAFAMLADKRDRRPGRRHGNSPL
ncbi:MAG: acyl-CoA carboxylase subunit beta [Ilumatobacteraceae bacterium]